MKELFSSAEAVSESLRKIREGNAHFNAFIETYDEETLRMAQESDERRRTGRLLSPLDGVPFALKDSYCYQGHRCECASRILEGFRAPYTATVVERLIRAGCIPIGRCNMDEFAMGSRGEFSKYGFTKNPVDPEKSAGGSSSGCAAAVAAGFVPFALGSDTGGSVRLPAAYCGICGYKPERGMVSRYGLVAFAASLDSVGILAESAEWIPPIMDIIAGTDGHDSTLLENGWQDGNPIRQILLEDAYCPVSPKIEAAVESLGLEISIAEKIDFASALWAYKVISSAEATSNLARYDGLRYGRGRESVLQSRTEGFGEEVQRRLLTGIGVLTERNLYERALAFREKLCKQMDRLLSAGNVLLTPTSVLPAPKLGEAVPEEESRDRLTVLANLCGLPSLTIRGGLCLTGAKGSGRELLRLGVVLEKRLSRAERIAEFQ